MRKHMKRDNQTVKPFFLYCKNSYLLFLILDPPLKKKSIPKIDLTSTIVADRIKDKKGLESGEYYQLTLGKVLSKTEI